MAIPGQDQQDPAAKAAADAQLAAIKAQAGGAATFGTHGGRGGSVSAPGQDNGAGAGKFLIPLLTAGLDLIAPPLAPLFSAIGGAAGNSKNPLLGALEGGGGALLGGALGNLGGKVGSAIGGGVDAATGGASAAPGIVNGISDAITVTAPQVGALSSLAPAVGGAFGGASGAANEVSPLTVTAKPPLSELTQIGATGGGLGSLLSPNTVPDQKFSGTTGQQVGKELGQEGGQIGSDFLMSLLGGSSKSPTAAPNSPTTVKAGSPFGGGGAGGGSGTGVNPSGPPKIYPWQS